MHAMVSFVETSCEYNLKSEKGENKQLLKVDIHL